MTNNNIINSQYLGLYGKDGSTINHLGTMTIHNGIGILTDGINSSANLNGGSISGTTAGITSVVGKNNGKITLNGTNILLAGTNTVGIIVEDGTLMLNKGNISVGSNGTGIYSKNSSISLNGYTGTISLGNKGIAIYAENSNINSGAIMVSYSSTTDMGVGIYYKGVSSVINAAEIIHSGNHLVNIYTDGVNLKNTANQTVNNDGIGIYGDNNAVISNQGVISLTGTDTVGIYLNNSSTISELGTITGNSVVSGNKIGVYIKNGDITGSSAYNFGIGGGVGIYLENNSINYTGTMNVTGNSTPTDRTIGIYVNSNITDNLGAKINITGKDAVGIYLAENSGVGANIVYNGELAITSASSADRGIGALLEQGTVFTLGAGGKVNIGGTNNIGFYVKSGASLNVLGGTVTNTSDGIFAYLDNGHLHFTASSMLDINYTNVIVSGGTILNDTAITVGSSGLQGDGGAQITNSNLGTINGATSYAKALVGSGTGTVLTNNGGINLTGSMSIGLYVENGALGSSSGHVTVGEKSAAYYAGAGGNISVSGTTSLGKESTMFFADGGNINYTGADIVLSDRSIALTLSDATSSMNFNNKKITTGISGTGVFITGTGNFSNVLNLDMITVQKNSAGIYMDNFNAVNTSANINLTGDESIGIFTVKNGSITYSGNMLSTALSTKGIIGTGKGVLTNNGIISLTGISSIGMYGENGSIINNSTVEVGDGSYTGGILNSAVAIYGKQEI